MIINIATDCSGIEAPIQALKKMGIQYNHVFSSEIDKYARTSIEANYNPKILFQDITNRDLNTVKDEIDMYVCGFPCQPFSVAGPMLGFEDERSGVLSHCVNSIAILKPKLFVLENVNTLFSNSVNYEHYKTIIDLAGLKDYEIDFKVLNTKDYGIPQNRKRIYIVGLLKKCVKHPFEWPKPVNCRNLSDFVDETRKESERLSPLYEKYAKELNATFINMSFIKFINPKSYTRYTPTITARGRFWNVKYHRNATIKELLTLQGFPEDFKVKVSYSQFRKQVGNSMSVNVLENLFRECFKSLNWI